MVGLGCAWNRPRLERSLDEALSAGRARAVEAHVQRCDGCRSEIDRLRRLRALVQEATPPVIEPDWSAFWPGVQARIVTEAPRPLTEPWWLPLWKPLWGHPRLAFGGVTAAIFAAVVSFWPGGDSTVPSAWAQPVVVQDVTTELDRSVMVYSSPDHGLTVIWVFSPEGVEDPS